MVKNIIFDIGNVILKFSRDFLVSHFYKGEEVELLKDALFRDWEKLDEDLLSLEEYKQNVLNRLPIRLHAPAIGVLDNWEYFMRYTDGIIPLIQDLKNQGYNLYILSNMTYHFINRKYKFPIFDFFDGIVFSAPIKMVKPNPEIYQYLLDKFSLNPTESLFIDDIKENLAGAARFGIKTFLFNNNAKELREFISTL
ncbi:MAG: HAD family phosphatase [Clostridia bacterium]|nr:HAD family phosphatase [Clostridia bacterium]